MNFNRVNVQNKLIYSITAISILAISILGYIGYAYTKDAYIDKVMITEHNDIEDISSSIHETISIMKGDAHFIANFYAMQKLLDWQNVGVKDKIARWDSAAKNTFKSIIDLKKFYYKLRILDMDGKEVINVFYDHKKQKAVVQTDDKLQDRKKKKYFSDTININQKKVYISQLYLNMEFGKIIYPHVPIVHFSALIYDKNGDTRGVAVINAYVRNIIDSVIEQQGSEKNRVVIDKNGYFIYHKDDNKRWGEQLAHGENYKNYNADVFKDVSSNQNGTFENENKLYNYKRIYPDVNNKLEYWIVISEVNKDEVFAPLKEFEKIFYFAFLLTAFLLIFGIKTYISRILSPLNLVTSQLKSLSEGEVNLSDIKYESDDEIKDLIESSKKLVQNINNTIEQAKLVSSGDFTKRIDVVSDKDSLGNSINDMTNRLDSVATLAKKLSNGDVDTEIVVDNKDDTLGLALSELLKYLKEITSVAESVSVGNFDVNFSVASEEDRLGIAINEMMNTLKQIVEQANNIADGNFTQSITPKSEKDRLGFALKKMTNILEENRNTNKIDSWLKDGIGQLSDTISGIEDLGKISNDAITNIVKHVNGVSGVFFLFEKDSEEFFLNSSYAFSDKESNYKQFKLGEGVVGQVGLEQKSMLLKNIQDDNYNIESGIVSQKPLNTYIFPFIYEGTMIGVAEVASFESFKETDKLFMDKAATVASAFLYNAIQNHQIKELLEESQRAFEELQVKSEELQQSNVQMEEQQQQLENQAYDLKNNNKMLEKNKEELDARAQELERSNQYKSEFLANMSHELRTPLNSIILLSKLLSEDESKKLDEDDIKKANVIHKSGQDLLLLINDILDLSKIESGHMDILYEHISSNELTSDMEDTFTVVANQNNVGFIIEDSYKSNINTDRTKLYQIIKNLLSNAFKFTKKGSVTLGIKYDEGSELPIIINVQDTGIGIPDSKKEVIFEAFKQVDGSISRNYGGTGLGLSISKKFSELIGAKLTIESEENVGSRFTLSLPLDTSSSLLIKPKSDDVKDSYIVKSERRTNKKRESEKFLEDIILNDENHVQESIDKVLKGKTVLITDDDSRNIFSLSALLQKEGVTTLHALNGKDAIKLLEDKKVDLVLMDIMMPEMDGYTTIKKIRGIKKFEELPIIALTAKAMKDDKQKCIDAGADDYMAKPVDKAALLLMIKAWISNK